MIFNSLAIWMHSVVRWLSLHPYLSNISHADVEVLIIALFADFFDIFFYFVDTALPGYPQFCVALYSGVFCL